MDLITHARSILRAALSPIRAASVSVLLVPAAAVAQVDSTTLRLTDVIVKIQNDRENDGTYRAQGMSRICGKFELMMPHRVNSFVVEFPDDETNLDVMSFTFDSDTLAAGSTSSSFYLKVAIRTPDGGTPPSYVVRTKEPQYQEPGTAQRFKKASRDSLHLKGVASKGTKVDIEAIVVCQPKA